MNSIGRTRYCGEFDESLCGEQHQVCGWVHNRRDLGGLIFLELRDRSGLVQALIHPEQTEIFKIAEGIRKEYVVQLAATVAKRPEGTVRPDQATGAIELQVTELKVLADSVPLPFYPDENMEISDEVRLKYRYLDLRRLLMTDRLQMRARIIKYFRDFLSDNGFIEVETPILTKATPEGARDYLVPSRTHLSHFFALPQSPQLFKQLLMIGGLDRYYQIARCFRDEDLRADRQPEFSQLDMELSFVDEQQIMQMMEQMFIKLFATVMNVKLDAFQVMTYEQAMTEYGIDKPDLRNPLKLVEIAELVADSDFALFKDAAANPGSRVAALRVPGATRLSRKQLDALGKGFAYIKVNDLSQGINGLQSSLLKNLSPELVLAIMQKVAAKDNDIVFIAAGAKTIVAEILSGISAKLAVDLELLEDDWRFLWVVDFPMFEWDADAKRWNAMHHPFTAPKINSIDDLQESKLGQLQARAYDLVLNGVELGSGSIRISDSQVQHRVLELLSMDKAEIDSKFGFLVNALQCGAPPHGGVAFGIDRLVMLLCGATSIRDVIAFPKTQSAACPLTGAPSTVAPEQLASLAVKTL